MLLTGEYIITDALDTTVYLPSCIDGNHWHDPMEFGSPAVKQPTTNCLMPLTPFVEGRVLFTNYRLIILRILRPSIVPAVSYVPFLAIPNTLISSVEKLGGMRSTRNEEEYGLVFTLMTPLQFKMIIPKLQNYRKQLFKMLVASIRAPAVFTEQHVCSALFNKGVDPNSKGWFLYDPFAEYRRMGVDTSGVTVDSLNQRIDPKQIKRPLKTIGLSNSELRSGTYSLAIGFPKLIEFCLRNESANSPFAADPSAPSAPSAQQDGGLDKVVVVAAAGPGGGSAVEDMRQDLCDALNSKWVLTAQNASFTLCDTYPGLLVIPREFVAKTSKLYSAAAYRAQGRLPVLSWKDAANRFGVLLRSSQPLSGTVGKLRQEADADAEYLMALAASPVNDPAAPSGRKLVVIDARTRANVQANAFMGKGTERYDFCIVRYMNIDTMQVLRDCFVAVRQGCVTRLASCFNYRLFGRGAAAGAASYVMSDSNLTTMLATHRARREDSALKAFASLFKKKGPESPRGAADGKEDRGGREDKEGGAGPTEGGSEDSCRENIIDGAVDYDIHAAAADANELSLSDDIARAAEQPPIAADAATAAATTDAGADAGAGSHSASTGGRQQQQPAEHPPPAARAAHSLSALYPTLPVDDDGAIQQVAASRWIYQKRLVIGAAMSICENLVRRNTVLVHCADGWDRTAQLTSLAGLLIDPHYRTVRGFVTLVEKEWVSFGHRFGSRLGMLDYATWFDEDEDDDTRRPEGPAEHGAGAGADAERQREAQRDRRAKERRDDELAPRFAGRKFSPVFLLWLEAVAHFVALYPAEFEFGMRLLTHLAFHSMSSRHGTFVFDAEIDRLLCHIPLKTNSVWDGVCGNAAFYNPDYRPCSVLEGHGWPYLKCDPNSRALWLWEEFWLQHA